MRATPIHQSLPATRSHRATAVVMALAIGLAGCSSQRPSARVASAQPTLLAVVPVQPVVVDVALESARRAVVEADARRANVADAQALLDRAEAAARLGQVLRANRLARAAQAQAEAAINLRFVALAHAEREAVGLRTILSESQAATVREADAVLALGDARRAYDLLAHLNQSARIAQIIYRVTRGDSLWGIAARPDIYDNGFLWPLIYRANTDRLSSPSALRAGMDLQIPKHPTVDATYEALLQSGGLQAGEVRVGRIRVE